VHDPLGWGKVGSPRRARPAEDMTKERYIDIRVKNKKGTESKNKNVSSIRPLVCLRVGDAPSGPFGIYSARAS
jgi:hypothetical protein